MGEKDFFLKNKHIQKKVLQLNCMVRSLLSQGWNSPLSTHFVGTNNIKEGHSFCLVPQMHWIRYDYYTCSFLNTCHDHSGFNVTGHWIVVTPIKEMVHIKH